MIGKSHVFAYGNLYAGEIERLIKDGRIEPAEAAAILAQNDRITELEIEMVEQQHDQSRLLRILSKVGDHRRIEAMLFRKMNPRIVRQIRKRRFESYRRIWRDARAEFLADSLAMRRQYAEASEWPMYLREELRMVTAWRLFASLYFAGLRYRFGFRPNVQSLTLRMGALLVDLPHRSVGAA